jgi:mono/diheme cytochrome c family protein
MRRLIHAVMVAGAIAFNPAPFTALRIFEPATKQAHGTPTVWDGVYTEEQATRGRSTYLAQSCVRCHGETLVGTEFGPSLMGDEFVTKWSGMTVGDLFVLIRETMPQDNPGRLSTQQTADIVSYLLKTNDFPAGQTALDRDPSVLKTIKIEQKSTRGR